MRTELHESEVRIVVGLLDQIEALSKDAHKLRWKYGTKGRTASTKAKMVDLYESRMAELGIVSGLIKDNIFNEAKK